MSEPKYHSDTFNENEDTTVEAKRVKGYLWDSENSVYVRQTGTPDGMLAVNHPLNQYVISDVDRSNPRYAGYLRSDGAYYIVKSTRTDDTITHRYSKGSSGYTTAWANRASETYNYFDIEF